MKGDAFVVFAASGFASSVGTLSQTVDKLSAFIRSSPQASTSLIRNLDGIDSGLDALIPAAQSFSQAIHDVTDQYGNLNVLKLSHVVDTLNDVSRAQLDVSAAIQAKLKGIRSGSTTNLDDLVSKLKETSQAKQGFADVADAVHGATGLVFGTAADLLSVVGNIAALSKSLYGLAAAVSALSNPLFDDLVAALNDLARTEGNVSTSFDRLNYL